MQYRGIISAAGEGLWIVKGGLPGGIQLIGEVFPDYAMQFNED
jgi:hypothetical protein